MGEVYLADDVVLGRRVALKLIQRGKGGTLLSHFRHERRVLAGLNHPNIAQLYGGAVTPEGRAYLVMEYVEGERLDKYCAARALPLAERLKLFRKICAAVSYAHQNLVIHRDLKPANIRVTPEGEPKLLDFGIAKLLEPEGSPGMEPTATMSGALTPEYASPEQLRGEPITTASDVYSLGVVLYELLCGERPYLLKGRRPDELARAICEEDPPRASTVAGRGPTTDPTGLTTDTTIGLQTVGGEDPQAACAADWKAIWTTSRRWPCERNRSAATRPWRSSLTTSAVTARGYPSLRVRPRSPIAPPSLCPVTRSGWPPRR